MNWSGGCYCGEVRYQTSQEPEWVGNCHCTICRRISGAAFSTAVIFSREHFVWTKGTPTYYHPQESVTRGFCAQCGSVLSWETEEIFSVFAGSLDRPEDLNPQCHTNTTNWLPWLKMDDGLPRLDEDH